MKIIKLEFPIFWYETFFMFKTSLLLLNFCLCVYMLMSCMTQSSTWLFTLPERNAGVYEKGIYIVHIFNRYFYFAKM